MSQVVLLDGGMGQELLRRSGAEATSLWSTRVILDQPALVSEVHADFIRSGARVITLSAYSATPERLRRDGIEAQFDAIHAAAAAAATDAVARTAGDGVRDTAVAIAGCLPPLVTSYRPDLMPPFAQALESYRRLVAVQAPHVDLMLCETMASVDEATAAATAARECALPLWVALTVEDNLGGRLRSGETIVAALEALAPLQPDAVLLNCSAPEAITAAWPTLARRIPVGGAYANGFTSIAGLAPGGTVATLTARQDLDPARYAAHALDWVSGGATIVGGCCEVGPQHIAALRQAIIDAGHTLVDQKSLLNR